MIPRVPPGKHKRKDGRKRKERKRKEKRKEKREKIEMRENRKEEREGEKAYPICGVLAKPLSKQITTPKNKIEKRTTLATILMIGLRGWKIVHLFARRQKKKEENVLHLVTPTLPLPLSFSPPTHIHNNLYLLTSTFTKKNNYNK
jgi:hypothetical protein